MTQLLPDGLSFQEYLQKASEEQRAAQEKAFEVTKLSSTACERLESLKEEVKVFVFSEGYCPDCIVTLPFIKRMEEFNSNIKVHILPLKGNEEKLKEFVGTARIPTVLAFNSIWDPKGSYVEVPEKLSEKMMSMTTEEKKELIVEYREGKYNDLIEEQLVNIIL